MLTSHKPEIPKMGSKSLWRRAFFKRNRTGHSKWDLVGDSGGSPGLENSVKRRGWFGQFVFLFTSMRAREKCMSKPMKKVRASLWKTPLLVCFSWARSYVFHELAPYRVGWYCNMAVSSTRSHLLCLLHLLLSIPFNKLPCSITSTLKNVKFGSKLILSLLWAQYHLQL